MEWQWNEFQQIGTDYASEAEVAVYDQRMRQVRDIDGENRHIVDLLQLPENAAVLEIGTGTGAFARTVSAQCRQVIAVDISPVMLQYASNIARQEDICNIVFTQAGFLNFNGEENAFDGIVTGLALHHLPDLWKAVALRNICSWLKPGGRLVLQDVVFDWKTDTAENYFTRIVASFDSSSSHLARHIAQEYSTLPWIMTGLLERAGLIIESDQESHEFLHCYCCRKP